MMELNVAFPGNRPTESDDESFVIQTSQMMISGGQEGGTTPLNLIMAGLGMCSGSEVLAFCRTRELPAGDVALRISPQFNAEEPRVEEIHVEILFSESFPEQYREPCLRAVSQCSVKKHLEAPLAVTVS